MIDKHINCIFTGLLEIKDHPQDKEKVEHDIRIIRKVLDMLEQEVFPEDKAQIEFKQRLERELKGAIFESLEVKEKESMETFMGYPGIKSKETDIYIRIHKREVHDEYNG
jgi:hypothetical protein